MHLCSGGKQAKLKELSNNISDRSKAKGTGIMSDLLLVNGEARQLVANPHYTILFKYVIIFVPKIQFFQLKVANRTERIVN